MAKSYKKNKLGQIVLTPKKSLSSALALFEDDESAVLKDDMEAYIGEYVFDRGVSHAVNRNVGRDIPSINDGLNFVERRLLYIMHYMNLTPNRPKVKLQSIIGTAIDKVYPHGDMSPVKTIARLGRNFSMMIPYVDKEGNFGTVIKKKPAAARYIEGRETKYAHDCFFSEDDVTNPVYDVKDTYKYDGTEPVNLATKYPNVLIQWNSGIGNGVSTMIAAFNINDVLEATLKLMDDPRAKIEIYPDTPMPLKITNKSELKHCFDMPRFPIKMQGNYRAEVIQDKVNGKIVDKYYIVFTSYPINSNADAIYEQLIAIKVEEEKGGVNKKFKEVKDVIVDCSDDGDKLEFFIEYEKGYDPDVLADKILKSTGFGDTIMTQYVLIHENQPKLYTPRTILLEWINIRIDQKRRYIQQKILKVALEKIITEALLKIFEAGGREKYYEIQKKAEDEDEFIQKIRKSFDLTELQAKSLAMARGTQFVKKNGEKYKARLQELDKEYTYYRSVCNEKAIREIIKEELREGIKKYGQPRRAELLDLDANSKADADEEKILVYNHQLYYCLESYDQLPTIADKIDKTFDIIKLKNSDTAMIFNKAGVVKVLDGYSFSYTLDGISLELASLNEVVKIIKATDKINELAFITTKGMGKIMDIKETMKSTKSRIINLAEGDTLASVIPVKDQGIVGMVADDKVYYVKVTQIPKLKRGSAGNRLIKTDINIWDSLFIDEKSEYMLLYGESGYVKVMSTQYLAFSKKEDNYISLVGKNIYGIIPLKESGTTLKLYDVEGKLQIDINIMKTEVEFISEVGKYKFPLSTSIGSPIKVLKKGKNDFYKIQ